jgi:cytochrome P450
MKPGRFAKRSSSLAISRICRTPGKRQGQIPLDEILLLCLLAMVAGAETITDIARFGRLKLALLRRFRPFEDGTPAHDHLAACRT